VYDKPNDASELSFLRQSENPDAVHQPQVESIWHVKQVEVSQAAQTPTTRNASVAARFMAEDREQTSLIKETLRLVVVPLILV
jgi:hypothetical protein